MGSLAYPFYRRFLCPCRYHRRFMLCLLGLAMHTPAGSTVAHWRWQARATFRLTLEEGGVFTSCEIRTIHQVATRLNQYCKRRPPKWKVFS